eukprot:5988036-Pyramimonas_sp.AAC.1
MECRDSIFAPRQWFLSYMAALEMKLSFSVVSLYVQGSLGRVARVSTLKGRSGLEGERGSLERVARVSGLLGRASLGSRGSLGRVARISRSR